MFRLAIAEQTAPLFYFGSSVFDLLNGYAMAHGRLNEQAIGFLPARLHFFYKTIDKSFLELRP